MHAFNTEGHSVYISERVWRGLKDIDLIYQPTQEEIQELYERNIDKLVINSKDKISQCIKVPKFRNLKQYTITGNINYHYLSKQDKKGRVTVIYGVTYNLEEKVLHREQVIQSLVREEPIVEEEEIYIPYNAE